MLKIIPFVVLAATCFAGTDELDVRLRPTVVGCGNAQLPALPVSHAPFERSAEVSRRLVTLAAYPFSISTRPESPPTAMAAMSASPAYSVLKAANTAGTLRT